VFIRWVFPSVVILAMVVGLLSGFVADKPKLETYYDEAMFQLANQSDFAGKLHGQIANFNQTYAEMDVAANSVSEQLADIRTVLTVLAEDAELERKLDAEQKQAVDKIVSDSAAHVKETGDALDSVLATILGKPIGQTFGKRANIKVFSLKEAGYRGYMAKIKLHDPKALKLVLAEDKVGSKGETTSASAKRTEATLAINAGGFAKQDGLLWPMGITVVDGEIKTWYSTDLSFIGINKNGHLVGGDIKSKDQIEEMDIMHGATFVPTLLKGGEKQTIPKNWKNKKEPRTLIGHFSNGDLLLIVIDGRSKDSSGVTLEEAQTKLLEWNVRDAYNLDGGGSSSFVYKGKVLNSPSDGRERKVVSNFVVIP